MKYEVRELKNVVIDGRPLGVFLILDGDRYVATVEFDYFNSRCNEIDSVSVEELPEAYEMVATYIVTKIQEKNIIPPMPDFSKIKWPATFKG